METRARYLLIGLFALVVLSAGFAFVYWLENTSGIGKRTQYKIEFNESVAGLLLGSSVQFNGIQVGEVTDLRLNPDDPRQVLVTIAVAVDTPIRADTRVGLVFGGLTGVPEIALAGGTADAGPPPPDAGGMPLLVAAPGTSVAWTDAAREAFGSVQTLISSNSDALGDAITNIDTFSKALAKNSDKLDGIVDGLARLAGAGGQKPSGNIMLAAPTDFPTLTSPPTSQLVIARPSDVVALETQRILVQSGATLTQGFPDAQWGDTTPLLLQAKLVETFENAGITKVTTDSAGLMGDVTLLIELRAFQVVSGDQPEAKIDLTAKLTDSSGAIVATKRFEDSAPLAAMTGDDAAAAFSAAFGKIGHALVDWTLPHLS